LTFADIGQEAVRERLRRLWVEHGVILFRDGDTGEDFQLDLSRIFGPLEAHPIREVRAAEKPELITLIATPENRTVVEIDGEVGGGYLGWHTDLVYVDRINHGGILRAIRPSQRGGVTGYIDQIDAYNRLSDELKARIDGLDAVYRLGPFDAQRYMTRSKVRVIKTAERATRALGRTGEDFPPVAHPLVFVQPETGRKVLNFSPFFAMYVDGMDAEESHTLL
jgi:taurine dioxygenase